MSKNKSIHTYLKIKPIFRKYKIADILQISNRRIVHWHEQNFQHKICSS